MTAHQHDIFRLPRVHARSHPRRATTMIIGTKSQWFPSPLSTSIDFDNLIVRRLPSVSFAPQSIFIATAAVPIESRSKAYTHSCHSSSHFPLSIATMYSYEVNIVARLLVDIKNCNFVVRMSKNEKKTTLEWKHACISFTSNMNREHLNGIEKLVGCTNHSQIELYFIRFHDFYFSYSFNCARVRLHFVVVADKVISVILIRVYNKYHLL